MAETPKVYVICDQNCKFESMTKEQILTAIMQAVNEGTIGDIDTGFIQTIKTINGQPLRFFVGDQPTYDALPDEDKQNLFAIITNDITKDELLAAIADLEARVISAENTITNAGSAATVQANLDNAISGLKNGTTVVAKADYATISDHANTADYTLGADRAGEATTAIQDIDGNDFVTNYWNSTREAETSAFKNNVTLTGKGVYLVTAEIPSTSYAEGNFKSSTLLYFDGTNATVSMLNVVINSYGTYAYRVKVDASGKLTIQEAYKTEGLTKDYADIEYELGAGLYITCRKIA